MFNFLNSESLWIGTDVKKFNEIRTQLEQEGIPYKYKTKDHLSQIHGSLVSVQKKMA